MADYKTGKKDTPTVRIQLKRDTSGARPRITPVNASAGNAMAPRPQKRSAPGEKKIYGTHAVDALFARRKEDIIKVYLHEDVVHKYGYLLKWCATQKRAYHVVLEEDLERVTQSVHHQGICVVAKDRNKNSFETWIEKDPRGVVLFLDGVENPHNVGAILRTAAHFGVHTILWASRQSGELSSGAIRTSEGGYEWVEVIRVDRPGQVLSELLNSGFQLVAASALANKSVTDAKYSTRTVFILGDEVAGLGPWTEMPQVERVKVPGTGAVESLNVSVSAAVLMSEYRRQNPLPKA